MQGINEFIIEIGKAFKDTMSYGTLELYTDYRTKQQEQSNRQGIVISTPMQIATRIKEGAEVIIDPTALFEQIYKGKVQQSRFLVNEEKGWYRFEPDMVILYKNPGETQWTGNKQNLFVTPIKVEEKTVSGIIQPVFKEKNQGLAKVAFINRDLEKQGVAVGDIIFYPNDRNWKFELEGNEYLYLRNIDVLAIQL